EIAGVRDLLDEFVQDVFGSLPRKDQRGKGGLYLQGLMLDGRRKSMQPMGDRLGIDYQQLQQFVSSSPWPVEPVRRVLARKAIGLIEPEAWVIDDTGFKKDGPASPGVARQYSGTLGKIGNVQIGVSLHAATDAASCPLDWRLFLPEAWDDTCQDTPDGAEAASARRAKAQIPDTVRHRTKWELALEMLDELATWGYRPPLICADAGYGEVTPFRLGLTEWEIPYVVAVKSTTSAYPDTATPGLPDYTGRGPRPRTVRYQQAPSSVKDLAGAREAFTEITWRHGTRTGPGNPTAQMVSQFAAVRVRPANRNVPRATDGTLPLEWLIAEWPAGAAEPTDYWMSTLPEDTPLPELVRLAKIRWRIEHDYRELKQGLGLAHFEGRTWLGWHHHTTLVTAAHLFVTTLRLTADPKAHGAA
ncbi:IS701 family transposase, partial [Agromyces neolithicus]|uniref:IS701 family transposase n=1 Tax=Agromyces neolithicus TaxID=269420 RepID=UPI003CD0B7E7